MVLLPISGLNLMVSLGILIYSKIFGTRKDGNLQGEGSVGFVLSFLIIVGVLFIFVYLSWGFVSGFVVDEVASECSVEYHSLGERNVVLRLDDVQGASHEELEMMMIDEVRDRGLTMTLGVIPKGLLKSGHVVNFLKKHRCKDEISLHGFDHTNAEFSNLSYVEAKKKILDGLEILRGIEENIVSFVPPENEISKEAVYALKDCGIKIDSAGWWNSEFGYDASAYDWADHELNDVDEILIECERSFEKKGICVIMIHPQIYVGNYDQFLKLLDGLEAMNVNFVNFRDLYHYRGRGIVLEN